MGGSFGSFLHVHDERLAVCREFFRISTAHRRLPAYSWSRRVVFFSRRRGRDALDRVGGRDRRLLSAPEFMHHNPVQLAREERLILDRHPPALRN